MAVTVTSNRLTISHKGSGGHEKNSVPDVCKTPVGNAIVPLPYSIIAFSKDLKNGSTSVFADGGNSIAIKGSVHSKCIGDAPGVHKGVASGTTLHESSWITYSPDVYVEGKNICRLSDKMFMNKKNTISGVGGHYEVPKSIKDPIMRELCKVFCDARDEWHKCKKTPGAKCSRPSTLAKNRMDKRLGKTNSGLNQAIKKKFPKGFGAAEKMFFSPADKMFEGARKIYSKSGMQRALNRQVKKVLQRAGAKKLESMAARSWMKLVPGLNVLSTIYDVADTIYTAADIYNAINSADMFKNAIKVQPDFAVVGEDGSIEKIYDFKFDDPDTGYQDKWQEKQKQYDAYKKASGDVKPEKVDNKTCKCDKKKGVATS